MINCMVQNAKDFSLIKYGKFKSNLSEFNIKKCLERVINYQRVFAQMKGVVLKAHYIDFKENFVKSDE